MKNGRNFDKKERKKNKTRIKFLRKETAKKWQRERPTSDSAKIITGHARSIIDNNAFCWLERFDVANF